jgi:hypothetical protein
MSADYNDHGRIWAALDKAHGKHADMIVLHGGSPKGAERIGRLLGRSPQDHPDRLLTRLEQEP